jgi:hypothetical protein
LFWPLTGLWSYQIHTPDPATTSSVSSNDVPGHGDFITTVSDPWDWRVPQNDTLWQGVSGTNNPCSSGFRLPTDAEWETERLSWSSYDAAGALASPLKLVLPGSRSRVNGTTAGVDSNGGYWSSTVSVPHSGHLFLSDSYAGMVTNHRAVGLSVRCIKE